jgi:hypothetical protein
LSQASQSNLEKDRDDQIKWYRMYSSTKRIADKHNILTQEFSRLQKIAMLEIT